MLISPLISVIILLCVGDSQEKKEEDLQTAMDIIERRKARNRSPKDNKGVDDTMSQEQAIKELKEAKDLLELGVITQEEFNVRKTELLPYLLLTRKVPQEEKPMTDELLVANLS